MPGRNMTVSRTTTHRHKWMKYQFGSQVCSKCGTNRASTGYKYRRRAP